MKRPILNTRDHGEADVRDQRSEVREVRRPAACRLPLAASPAELEGRYRSTHDVHDLMAWSDAVGAESVQLCAEVDNFRDRFCLLGRMA
jgi:hypothetical protein